MLNTYWISITQSLCKLINWDRSTWLQAVDWETRVCVCARVCMSVRLCVCMCVCLSVRLCMCECVSGMYKVIYSRRARLFCESIRRSEDNRWAGAAVDHGNKMFTARPLLKRESSQSKLSIIWYQGLKISRATTQQCRESFDFYRRCGKI